MTLQIIILDEKPGQPSKKGVESRSYLVKCNICGKEFWKPKSAVLWGMGKFCSKKCQSEYQKSLPKELHHHWKGGRVKMNGYWYIRLDNNKYRREHIVVMETKLGRRLLRDEVVHHIDGDIENNNISNLQLTNKSSHGKIHYKEFKIDKLGRLTKKSRRYQNGQNRLRNN